MGTNVIIGAIVLITTVLLQNVSCMECQLGHESTMLEKLDFINPKSCPPLFSIDSDKKFCCVEDNSRVYCCDAAEFAGNGFGVLLPVLIAVGIGILVVCCLCCLCCPCCLLYKRRHRGTVYGNMLQPGVQTTVVTVPQAAPQQQAPVYPPQPTSMPMPQPGYSMPGVQAYPLHPGQQPPPYSEVPVQEAYAKQSPYNPSFQ